MSDIHTLIGKELQEGAERCKVGSPVTVDLSKFTFEDVAHPIVKGMIQEHKELHVFHIDPKTRVVTISWNPEQAQDLKAGEAKRLHRRDRSAIARLAYR